MDAVKYLKEKSKMCGFIKSSAYKDCVYSDLCKNCPLKKINCQDGSHPEEAVRLVEEWSKENPAMTNAMKQIGCAI